MAVPVVAIDGPSGSGKGTLAHNVADALGWHLLDSGALYRIAAFVADRDGIALEAEDALAAVLDTVRIEFRGDEVWVDGVECSQTIRTEDIGVKASKIAALPAVRHAMLGMQQRFRRAPGLVADGRDMGTVVFPDAEVKFFLDASVEARAERRYKQLKNKGLSVSLRDLLVQLKDRDARDRGRTIAPLVPAPDAHVIDSTDMSIDVVFTIVMRKLAERGISPSS